MDRDELVCQITSLACCSLGDSNYVYHKEYVLAAFDELEQKVATARVSMGFLEQGSAKYKQEATILRNKNDELRQEVETEVRRGDRGWHEVGELKKENEKLNRNFNQFCNELANIKRLKADAEALRKISEAVQNCKSSPCPYHCPACDTVCEYLDFGFCSECGKVTKTQPGKREEPLVETVHSEGTTVIDASRDKVLSTHIKKQLRLRVVLEKHFILPQHLDANGIVEELLKATDECSTT